MTLNIKKLLSLFVFSVQLMIAQDKDPNAVKHKRPTFFSWEINSLFPNYYGDNFITKGYDISNGFDFGSSVENFERHFNFHFNMSFYSGNVTQPEVVGFFESTNFFRISGGIGHTLNISEKLGILPSIHFGYIEMTHRVINQNRSDIEDKVKDTGGFIAIELTASYRVLVWLEITLGANHSFDFLAIEAGGQKNSFFRRPTAITPMLGFKITTRKK